jgi:hypothetical protein
MKCKPLCFDYHSEATYLLRARRKQSSSRIRISTRCIDDDEEEPSSPRIEETTTSAAATQKQPSAVDVEKRHEFHAVSEIRERLSFPSTTCAHNPFFASDPHKEPHFETSQDTKPEWVSNSNSLLNASFNRTLMHGDSCFSLCHCF